MVQLKKFAGTRSRIEPHLLPRSFVVRMVLVLTLGVHMIPSAEAQPTTHDQGTFRVTPFGGGRPSAEDVRPGIRKLFDAEPACATGPCLPRAREDQFVRDALNWHAELRAIAAGYEGRDMSYTYTKLPWDSFNPLQRIDFAFPSMIQSGHGENNDFVRGIHLLPRPVWCGMRFPTLVIVHSALDNLAQDELSLAANLVSLSQKMAVLIVYLPHYGPRRNVDARLQGQSPQDTNIEFFTPELGTLKRNVTQTMLDLHLALDWLEARKTADPEHTAMLGLSLGSLLQLLFEGVNPGRVGKGHVSFVGGGDLATIMSKYFHAYPQDLLTTIWKRRGWNEEFVRKNLNSIDPIAWSHRIRGQDVLYIGAEQDEIMDRHKSVQRLLNGLSAGSRVNERWLNTRHAPRDASLLELYFSLFLPIQQYVLRDVPPLMSYPHERACD